MTNERNQSAYDVIISGAGPVGFYSRRKRIPFGIRGLSAPSIEALGRRGFLAGRSFLDGDIDASHWRNRLSGSNEEDTDNSSDGAGDGEESTEIV